MQTEMIVRQVKTLAADLTAIAEMVEEDCAKVNERLKKNEERRKKGEPVAVAGVAMPARTGYIKDKLTFVKTRLQSTIDYIQEQNIG